jgi:hypothetical protein
LLERRIKEGKKNGCISYTTYNHTNIIHHSHATRRLTASTNTTHTVTILDLLKPSILYILYLIAVCYNIIMVNMVGKDVGYAIGVIIAIIVSGTVFILLMNKCCVRHVPSITEFFITWRLRCACYTCNYAPTAQYLATRKILLKLLRIEMENYHIIMTMGMYRIEPPWVPIY